MCLTVVAQLLEKYEIPKDRVGRIEVRHFIFGFILFSLSVSFFFFFFPFSLPSSLPKVTPPPPLPPLPRLPKYV